MMVKTNNFEFKYVAQHTAIVEGLVNNLLLLWIQDTISLVEMFALYAIADVCGATSVKKP